MIFGMNNKTMKLLTPLFIILSLQTYSQQTMETTHLNVGDSTLIINHQYIEKDSSVLFLNIHEDEQTSIESIREFNKTKAVNFIFIEHNKTRRITFNIKNKKYSFDPNRIYTRKGRRNTIEPKHIFVSKSKAITKYIANHIIKLIENYDVIVTLHNNTDVNYSIKSYQPGEDESENTAEVYVNDTWDPDDFIYTTEKIYFDYLKKEGVNVILQKKSGFVNDGSLSIYCGKKNIKYINIEAQKGHFNEQTKLIFIVDEMLQKLK
jgi:hypothetical protein